jgi:hypothetical protein
MLLPFKVSLPTSVLKSKAGVDADAGGVLLLLVALSIRSEDDLAFDDVTGEPPNFNTVVDAWAASSMIHAAASGSQAAHLQNQPGIKVGKAAISMQ